VFIFMGIVLQKTKLAEQLLEAMGDLFGNVRGGLAVSTILVGSLLAASTGVVGASVVAMGVISLPVMLKHNYKKTLSTGVICASGTLGQIIPPSIVLIILADVLGVPVGDLFQGAIMPSVVLIFQLRRWYNAAKTNAPTAPTAADSVGVAMPEKIEPSTATWC
jgi:TRAP-type mannitol/chloroaromatic compound transport system permease large subunit